MTHAYTYEESIHIDATPAEVYAVVSDITRTGEWSPVCKACWWDEADSATPARAGAWFTGRNEVPGRTWETRSQVASAEAGRSFGWSVGPGRVAWTYTMREADSAGSTASTGASNSAEASHPGTVLTESWEFLPEGLEFFAEMYGDEAPAQIAARAADARSGIPATLAAIKRVIETQ